MNEKEVTIKEKNLKQYVLDNFKEDAIIEVSYNRVFIPGKILFIDKESAIITIQLMGELLNQRVDLVLDDIVEDIVEIIYTKDDEMMRIRVTN